MKKVLILCFVCFFVALLVLPYTEAQAESNSRDTYALFDDFATQFPDRTPGSAGETQAAQYIAAYLSNINTLSGPAYVGSNGGSSATDLRDAFQTVWTPLDGTKELTITTSNVIAYKRSSVKNAPLLVISCEYGNAYSVKDVNGDLIGSEGAYEFSSSVATLLTIAYQLRNAQLSFDVAFAFFGAGCYQSLGVKHFLETNTQTLLGNIDLYAVGGGQDLYVYYDEISTAHGKFLDERIKRFGYDIKGAPFDKKYTSMDSDVFAFVHVGLSSSNYFFLREGVPSVELFGYNWKAFGNSESALFDNVLGTSSDTLNYMKTNYGESLLRERMDLAQKFVVGAVLTNGDLKSVLQEYKGGYGGLTKRSTYWIFTGVVLGLAAILFVVGAIVYARKAKAAGKPDFTVNAGVTSTARREEEDIFEFNTFVSSEPIEKQEEGLFPPENQEGTMENNRPDDDDIFGEF